MLSDFISREFISISSSWRLKCNTQSLSSLFFYYSRVFKHRNEDRCDEHENDGSEQVEFIWSSSV